MAFDPDYLVAVSNGAVVPGSQRRLTVYSYATNDFESIVSADGYFDDSTHLQKGDQIIASCDLDGTPTGALVTIQTANGADTMTSDEAT